MVALAPWPDDDGQDEAVNGVIAAERAILAAMINSPRAIEQAIEVIAPRDFHGRMHGALAESMFTMHAAGAPVDPVSVAAELDAAGILRSVGGRILENGAITTFTGPLYLSSLYAYPVPYTPQGLTRHAETVTRAAAIRRIREACMRGLSRADVPGADPGAVITEVERELAGAVTCPDTGTDAMDIGEFCSADMPRTAAVIPGLLHAAERVILVAGEGTGKTTLGRQVWVMTAAGLHPFTGEPIPPKRTLYLDLENPQSIVQAKARSLLDLARRQPGWDDRRARIWCRPGGIDVRQPADAQQLAAVIKATAPDLIIAGPLYKMTVDGGERAEQLHSAVAAFWDRMRDRHGVALWLEAHAPMAQGGAARDLRPLGSGVWQRWPEFGISLRPADGDRNELKLGRFRGDRDERLWPDKLIRPAGGEQWRWPWKAIFPPGTFGQQRQGA